MALGFIEIIAAVWSDNPEEISLIDAEPRSATPEHNTFAVIRHCQGQFVSTFNVYLEE